MLSRLVSFNSVSYTPPNSSSRLSPSSQTKALFDQASFSAASADRFHALRFAAHITTSGDLQNAYNTAYSAQQMEEGGYYAIATVKITKANLADASLKYANLYGAVLSGANLQGANLQGARLQGANLQGANLQGANLYGAVLSGANLQGVNLKYANLQGANLQGANLQGANLQGAKVNLTDLTNVQSLTGATFNNQTLSNIIISLNEKPLAPLLQGFKGGPGDYYVELKRRLEAVGMEHEGTEKSG